MKREVTLSIKDVERLLELIERLANALVDASHFCSNRRVRDDAFKCAGEAYGEVIRFRRSIAPETENNEAKGHKAEDPGQEGSRVYLNGESE